MSSTVAIPPLPKKTAVRRMIELWSEGKQLGNIVRMGLCHVYLVPSASDPGGYYVVAYDEEGDQWACACKGFRFNKKRDSCRHVEIIIEKEKEASRQWKGSTSIRQKASNTSGSSRGAGRSGSKSEASSATAGRRTRSSRKSTV